MKYQREGGFLIAKIHQLSGRILARKLREYQIHEINPAQGRILFALWKADGIPIGELGKRTSLGNSTLTSMLDRLEKAGFVMRLRSQEDRRVVLISRTEKDRAWQEAYIQVSREMTDLFYDEFSENEIDEFENYLRRIFRNLSVFEDDM